DVDLGAGRESRLLAPGPVARTIATTPGGDLVLVGCVDGTVRLVSPRGEELRSWSWPFGVPGLAISEDGALVAAGCDDGTIRILPTGLPRRPLGQLDAAEAKLLAAPDRPASARALFSRYAALGLLETGVGRLDALCAGLPEPEARRLTDLTTDALRDLARRG